MSNVITLRATDPSVKRILAAAFPGARPQTINAHVSESISFYGTNWDSGRRRVYVMVELATMKQAQLPHDKDWMQGSESYRQLQSIPPGMAVVVHNDGYRESYEIWAHPATISGMLPAPVELSPYEKIVLVAVRSLKSSYAGISDYRLHEAQRNTGITAEQYQTAKSQLIERKLLNKAGAITPEGRNAIGRDCDLWNMREILRNPELLPN